MDFELFYNSYVFLYFVVRVVDLKFVFDFLGVIFIWNNFFVVVVVLVFFCVVCFEYDFFEVVENGYVECKWVEFVVEYW